MNIKKKIGDPIDVEWFDVISCSGWYDILDLEKHNFEECFTRGWFVGQTKNSIFVTLTKDKEIYGQILDFIRIPKSLIKRAK